MKSDWAISEDTLSFIKRLKQDKQDIMEHWAVGSYTAETDSGTCQLNAQALGRIEAIDQIIIWIQDNEDEAEGVQSPN